MLYILSFGKIVVEESDVWRRLKEELKNSTCLKTNTAAALVKNGEVLSVGWNLCAPESYSYGDKILACPRMNIKTGTEYELCSPVHAEVMACLNVRPNRDLSDMKRYASHLELGEGDILGSFTKEELGRLKGSTLYLMGHYWACGGCRKFLKTIGVDDIKFDKIMGDKTEKRYIDGNLA